MDINVLDIKGQETGRKVTLNESIFGIEPNDHVIYLDVKQYMANQRQGTAKAKERVAAAHVMAISTLRCSRVVAACLVPVHATMASSSTRK